MENPIFALAEKNQKRAKNIIEETNIINIWKSIGAEINLGGSLRMGLLLKHKDIDFHIYTTQLNIYDSFKAIAQLAQSPSITKIEYNNLIDTEEHCIEWHAWYIDKDNDLWQIDMIHILKGSRYDGYFEKVADNICAALTPEKKLAILTLKNETPDTEKIMGIEYYQAVIENGIDNYSDFIEWRKKHPANGIVNWIP